MNNTEQTNTKKRLIWRIGMRDMFSLITAVITIGSILIKLMKKR